MRQRRKTFRIFISSTFRDMHAERDHLARFAFPEVKEKCRQQRVHLIDVDLRWGVTEAGTKSLVMNMWSVPDKGTKELMVAFYKNIIKGGTDRCQALRGAALNEMLIVKNRYGMANPAYWGVILMGQPR